jgi:hypothetical protein
MAIMDDGFSTTIAFSEDSSVQMQEIEVTPPGVSGGGEIDQTSMQNTTWRTAAPKSLKTLTDGSLTVAYDPDFITEIIAMVNVNQQITVTFPGAETLVFWGWIDEFAPGAQVEGQRPTASVTLKASNLNGSNVETAPEQS